MGTIWSWYGLCIFNTRGLYHQYKIVNLLTTTINCFLFPLGLVLKKFIYCVQEKEVEIDEASQDIVKTFGIVIEPLIIINE